MVLIFSSNSLQKVKTISQNFAEECLGKSTSHAFPKQVFGICTYICTSMLIGSESYYFQWAVDRLLFFFAENEGESNCFSAPSPSPSVAISRSLEKCWFPWTWWGDVSCGRSVCCWLESIHQPDLLGAERRALVKSVSQSRAATHKLGTRLRQVHALTLPKTSRLHGQISRSVGTRWFKFGSANNKQCVNLSQEFSFKCNLIDLQLTLISLDQRHWNSPANFSHTDKWRT